VTDSIDIKKMAESKYENKLVYLENAKNDHHNRSQRDYQEDWHLQTL
jgi:hypothetical protein